jgi:UDP-N-acetylmuramoyl-L-alanyl-D-glutamate--2,6-diaminopimelate ligase
MIRPISEACKSIKDIARFLGDESSLDISIKGISSNSDLVEPGDLFVALPGSKVHGANFVEKAKINGATAVLTDKVGAEIISGTLPNIVTSNPRAYLGPLSDWFYGNPSSAFDLYGITGTNGKTTTTYLLNQFWKSAGRSTLLLGTLGIELCGESFSSGFTTPEADSLAKIFAAAREKQIKSAVMEVSSIAIEMARLKGTKFKCVGFSNLTQDHLDFHGNMENYGRAKGKLFSLEYAESALINIDDPFGSKLFSECEIIATSLSRNNPKAIWHYTNIITNGTKSQVSIRGEGGILIEGEINLIGDYNLDNLLMAVAMAFNSGIDPLLIAATLPILKGAPGRLEVITAGQNFIALVDYAHTPDAVIRVLNSARALSGRVIGVLGCGGDRDKTKRPIMGSALANLSDIAIFTSDNPRSEEPEEILKEMTANVNLDENKIVINDRREAIALAVTHANEGDCVIVLGKGHELGQEIKGKKHPFDDRVEFIKAIKELS